MTMTIRMRLFTARVLGIIALETHNRAMFHNSVQLNNGPRYLKRPWRNGDEAYD